MSGVAWSGSRCRYCGGRIEFTIGKGWRDIAYDHAACPARTPDRHGSELPHVPAEYHRTV